MKGRTQGIKVARTFAARALIALCISGVGLSGVAGVAQAAKSGGSITGHKVH
jgi:hypothetical protein